MPAGRAMKPRTGDGPLEVNQGGRVSVCASVEGGCSSLSSSPPMRPRRLVVRTPGARLNQAVAMCETRNRRMNLLLSLMRASMPPARGASSWDEPLTLPIMSASSPSLRGPAPAPGAANR